MADDKRGVAKFVLYSHYAHENEDWDAYSVNEKKPDDDRVPIEKLHLPGVATLERHLPDLQPLLTTAGTAGLLVLFYSLGYPEYLSALAKGVKEPRIDAGKESLRKEVINRVHRMLKDKKLDKHIRFITWRELHTVLGRVHEIFTEAFPKYLLGDLNGIRYDAPKIPEAIVRLRLLGNGVPVFRLDHDVIFPEAGESRLCTHDGHECTVMIPKMGVTYQSVASALIAYRRRMEDAAVSTFLFSASYDYRPVFDKTKPPSFEAWSRAFATRVQPTLLVDKDAIDPITKKMETINDDVALTRDKDEQARRRKERWSKEIYPQWEEYVKNAKHLDDAIVRKYYGINQDRDGFDHWKEGMTRIGAHSLYAVISGAMLCLSDGAILDLPPFSNLRANVMWIDDHLKYSLHRAMHHFTSGEGLRYEEGLGHARLSEVTVTKARPRVQNLPAYVFGTYLPSLLWGAIMDSWIIDNGISIIKCRRGRLPEKDRDAFSEARQNPDAAPLPKTMLEVLSAGHFAQEDKLREELEAVAVKRIELVRSTWAELRNGKETLASCWATGLVEKHFTKVHFDQKDDLWKGISPSPVNRLEDLSPVMMRKVLGLIDDAVKYVQWTIEWPRFVQIVRSIKRGAFMGDLSYTGESLDGPAE